eukprot:TRINITY_DN12055_c0_g1_i1.p1 TRINITY_DN12055_c0_g1~~TRINITY_DN12055_c0_g1_i1.p1  ORF type:complete len:333 (-),score=91.97 TRINITY_DN12055_c0_g1_i1:90-1088(-)
MTQVAVVPPGAAAEAAAGVAAEARGVKEVRRQSSTTPSQRRVRSHSGSHRFRNNLMLVKNRSWWVRWTWVLVVSLIVLNTIGVVASTLNLLSERATSLCRLMASVNMLSYLAQSLLFQARVNGMLTVLSSRQNAMLFTVIVACVVVAMYAIVNAEFRDDQCLLDKHLIGISVTCFVMVWATLVGRFWSIVKGLELRNSILKLIVVAGSFSVAQVIAQLITFTFFDASGRWVIIEALSLSDHILTLCVSCRVLHLLLVNHMAHIHYINERRGAPGILPRGSSTTRIAPLARRILIRRNMTTRSTTNGSARAGAHRQLVATPPASVDPSSNNKN